MRYFVNRQKEHVKFNVYVLSQLVNGWRAMKSGGGNHEELSVMLQQNITEKTFKLNRNTFFITFL